jgi:hypothetical protein
MPAEDRRKLLYLVAFAAAGIVALAVVLGFFMTRGNSNSSNGSAGPKNLNLATLPGIRRGPAPWDQGYNGLPDRLAPLGLDQLPQEMLKQHIHQHLDIYINGKHMVQPAGVGIYDNEFITELHTHSASAEGLPGPATRATGVIHVEAPGNQTYSLGQFFGVWGVYLSKKCIGGYCATAAKPLKFYVNGKPFTGDPVRLPLKEHEEIAIVYGKPPAKIPASFKWPSGL